MLRLSNRSDLTESHETTEIESLLKQVSALCLNNEYVAALRLAREALEIDETHIETLQQCVFISLKISRFEEGIFRADTLVELYPDHPLGYFLRGQTLLAMLHYRECLDSALKALKLEYEPAKDASSLVVKATAGILSLNDDFIRGLSEFDFYTQLGEAAIIMLQAKQHMLAVQITEVALGLWRFKLQTNQYGVTLTLYLTQGHALCATRQYDPALKSYESCLDLAISIHDVSNQTKALVNIAALHVSKGDAYKALITYERLHELHGKIESEKIACAEWTNSFVSHLCMNTSLAYKETGNHDLALHYANLSLESSSQLENTQETMDAHRHIGQLLDTVNKFPVALEHYKKYLAMAKCSGNKAEIALAYGHLGSLFSHIGLWVLSKVYHERHVSIALGLEDRKGAFLAFKMSGDSLMRQGLCKEACDAYSHTFKYADRSLLNQATALYLLGNSHLAREHTQHAVHYYDQAMAYCEDDFAQLRANVQFGIAQALCNANDSRDLEKGRKYCHSSISHLKEQIEQCLMERKFLPDNLLNQLRLAYQGMQNVLAKLGCDAECLEYAEESRIFSARLLMHCKPHTRIPLRLDWAQIEGALRQQGASVLYYSFLSTGLLMWLLRPDKGLARFYIKRPQTKGSSVEQELIQLLTRWQRGSEDRRRKELYKYEKRHIEKRSETLKPMERDRIERAEREAIRTAQSASSTEKRSVTSDRESVLEGVGSPDHGAETEEDVVIQKSLYKFLLSPMDDLLSDLPTHGHLLIVPDRAICHVLFLSLRDLKGAPVKNKFNITCIPGLFCLELIVRNQIKQLQLEDLAMSQMAQARLGGFYRFFVAPEASYTSDDGSGLCAPESDSNVDSRRVGNPRLAATMKSEKAKEASTIYPVKLTGPQELSKINKAYIQLLPQDAANDVKVKVNGLGNATLYTHPVAESPRYSYADVDVHRLKPSQPIPEPSGHDAPPERGAAATVHHMLRTQNYTTLITATSTGTDAVQSSTAVPEFKQASRQDRFTVIGCPALYTRMKFGSGHLVAPEAFAITAMTAELVAVSRCFGGEFIHHTSATRDRFLSAVEEASILHIVTQANLSDGYLLMSCEMSKLADEEDILEKHYIVTRDDIMALNSRAKLVVISAGATPANITGDQGKLQALPTAFIVAGAEAVITFPYPHQSEHLIDFFGSFYSSFKDGCLLCDALAKALSLVSSKHKMPYFPFHVYGNNIFINLESLRFAMLDQQIDKIEEFVIDQTKGSLLNIATPEKVPTPVEHMTLIQLCLAQLCALRQKSLTIGSLIHLVEDAVNLLRQPKPLVPNLVLLPTLLIDCPPAMQLLRQLHFHFLPRGVTERACGEPAVVFPCSDPDDVAWRVLGALKALQDLSLHLGVSAALGDALPMTQESISHICDMIALTKHAPHVQLRISDSSVAALWSSSSQHHLLITLGFLQIGSLIHFRAYPSNQSLLNASLRFFLMLSLHKSSSLEHKLEVNELGAAEIKLLPAEVEPLPSLMPMLLPKNRLVRRVPWASRIESRKEMDAKMALAARQWQSADYSKNQRQRAQMVHHSSAQVQAALVLKRFASPTTVKPIGKLKVLSGASASRNRIPVDYNPRPTSSQIEQRRKYANFLLKTRLHDIGLREQQHVNLLFSTHTDTVN